MAMWTGRTLAKPKGWGIESSCQHWHWEREGGKKPSIDASKCDETSF